MQLSLPGMGWLFANIPPLLPSHSLNFDVSYEAETWTSDLA